MLRCFGSLALSDDFAGIRCCREPTDLKLISFRGELITKFIKQHTEHYQLNIVSSIALTTAMFINTSKCGGDLIGCLFPIHNLHTILSAFFVV